MTDFISLCGGKYRIDNDNGNLTFFRNGEQWHPGTNDLRHSGVVLAMYDMIRELSQPAAAELKHLKAAKKSGDFSVRLTFASVRACNAFTNGLDGNIVTHDPISESLLAAVNEASARGELAGEHEGQIFFLNKGEELAHDPTQDCPACGGSGHAGDVTITSEGNMPPVSQAQQNPDDGAVDNFAEAMRHRMAANRDKGKYGWDDPIDCKTERLQALLVKALVKGDPVDVGNYAMMLFSRGATTKFIKLLSNGNESAISKVCCEVLEAQAKWPKFNSAHEGFAVLLEEVDELKAEVWLNQKKRDPAKMYKEASQVAAMAVRFMIDCCDEVTCRK